MPTSKSPDGAGKGMLPMTMCHVENDFDAPVDYCGAWLTDFRPDDGRLGGAKTPIEVVRNGNVVTRRTVTPLGPMTQVVTIESPRRWRVEGTQLSPDGTRLLGYTIVEKLEPRGSRTRHAVDIVLHEAHKTMVPMLDEIKEAWNANVTTIFSNVKPELEAAFKSGAAADA